MNDKKLNVNFPSLDAFLQYVKNQVYYLYYSRNLTEKQLRAVCIIKNVFDNIYNGENKNDN